MCVLLTLSEAGSQNTRDCAPRCPLNSSCVNGTACRCTPGFSSSSGEIFTNSLESCDDINECGPPLTVSCGKLADCENTEGGYHCMCSPGYELISGATTFKNESENTCRDVDECQQKPKICKGRSICINTQGSYTCQCPPGLELNLEDPRLCTDVNECTSGRNPCHSSSHCFNLVGTYQCHCRPGWKPIPGAASGPNNTICEDTDECSSGQHQCHNSTICVNTVGSYTCHCRQGWVPKPGFQEKQVDTISCEEISFPTWTAPPEIKSQSLSGFFERVQKMSIDFKSALTQETIQYLIMSVDDLLKTPGDLEALDLSSRHHTATYLFSGLEQILRTLAKAMSGGSFIYHSPGDTGPTVVGILSSPNMQKLLANASLDLDLEKQTELEEIYESRVRGAQLRLLSAVNLWEMPGTRQELICAFWKSDSNRRGYWATSGCQTLGSGNGSTTCQCNHLSSFAILMAHYDVEDWKLALITKVGLALSLVCLLLCILTFLLVRPIQGSRTTVHLHLCICLFVGSTIFLVGIENQGGQCNAVIFVITVWKLTQKFSEINPDIKKLKKARVLTVTAIAQLFVLGCTWVFGLFLFDHSSWVLCYTFSILNCLQGLFLFVLYCLLNKKVGCRQGCGRGWDPSPGAPSSPDLAPCAPQVREEYRRWACMVTRNKYSEFATSTSGSGSSHSQTQVRAEPGAGVQAIRQLGLGSVLTGLLSLQALRPSESGM
ncbi:hypothetical protein E2I00_012157 [Balaenoptera physalus]|uniref:Adhesion G protein-coupled receptor E5 n=1 Tax=Balaenoptera physalus TaxID=9770 RepID=A0A6A1QI63_BALPH|nr:hypothetical protein E2I00_012157 [Balaenoptera physalus]